MSYRLSDHGRTETARRGISHDLLETILRQPDQVLVLPRGRRVLQSRIPMAGREYLIRIVVDSIGSETVVVTAYRTSKIDKYWKEE